VTRPTPQALRHAESTLAGAPVRSRHMHPHIFELLHRVQCALRPLSVKQLRIAAEICEQLGRQPNQPLSLCSCRPGRAERQYTPKPSHQRVLSDRGNTTDKANKRDELPWEHYEHVAQQMILKMKLTMPTPPPDSHAPLAPRISLGALPAAGVCARRMIAAMKMLVTRLRRSMQEDADMTPIRTSLSMLPNAKLQPRIRRSEAKANT